LPDWLGDLMERPERFEVAGNDISAIQSLISGKSGAKAR
jgi:hypothetical protein